MKANELMIGDWVQVVEPCKYAGATGRVKTLIDHKDDENAYFKVFLKDNTIHIGIEDICSDDIRPIPLTPEILEKNGFVENRGITSWKFETNREDLIDIYGVNDYHLSINIEDTHGSGKGYRWMLNNLTIFYVHQLQHALRLCGINHEIIL